MSDVVWSVCQSKKKVKIGPDGIKNILVGPKKIVSFQLWPELIAYPCLFIASNSSSNSLCFLLSCNNGYRNVDIMDLTVRTTSV